MTLSDQTSVSGKSLGFSIQFLVISAKRMSSNEDCSKLFIVGQLHDSTMEHRVSRLVAAGGRQDVVLVMRPR